MSHNESKDEWMDAVCTQVKSLQNLRKY
jgi:hypothetical protein